MINAKKELLDEIYQKEVDLIRIVFGETCESQKTIEGTLDDVLPMLDFEYYNGCGCQELYGYIWYKDDTWSERVEYNGAEWWEYKKLPPKDIKIDT